MLGTRICHKNLLDPYLSQILMIKFDYFHLHQTVGGFKIGYPATFPICLRQCMVRMGSSWEFAGLNFLFKKLNIQKCLNPNATLPSTPTITQTPHTPHSHKPKIFSKFYKNSYKMTVALVFAQSGCLLKETAGIISYNTRGQIGWKLMSAATW